MIVLKNISKIYGNEDNKTVALANVDFKVKKGDFIGIMGPSGCGKSTLLNIIGLIDSPTSGEYYLKNLIIEFDKINILSEKRNNTIAFIFQNFALINDMTVLNNCLLPLKFRKGNKQKKIEKVEKYLKELGILNLKNKLVKELSGGQQQRVAISRALAQESEVILADEPTGALDAKNSQVILEMLQKLNKTYGKTVIVVTHDKEIMAFANKIYMMKDGKIMI